MTERGILATDSGVSPAHDRAVVRTGAPRSDSLSSLTRRLWFIHAVRLQRPDSAVSGWGGPRRRGGSDCPRRRPTAPRRRGARGRDEPLPTPAPKHQPHGDDMLTVDHTFPALVAELQA